MEQAGLRFAKRFDGVTGSAIRDILKYLAAPGIISFGGGNPADFALENERVAGLARDVLLSGEGKRILQYGATEGWTPYRVQAAKYLREEAGLAVTEENLLPTTGSTQAVDLLLKALIDEGDVVLVEGPSFLGSLQAMKLYGARLVSVPMDGRGLRMDALEEAARRHRPKLLYTVPTFQNPTGATLPGERREQIARLAARYGFVVAEDDPYRGLRYAGTPEPSVFSFDASGLVVYLTSFSKLIAPGLRVGAVVTKDPALLRKLIVGKQSEDLHTPGLTQAIVAEYLARGWLPAHVADVCGRYREQMNAMLDALADFPQGTRVTKPEGGLFVWVELREDIDAVSLLPRAIERGVAYVPGTYFFADGGRANTLRLNFSNAEPAQITKGMDILSKLLKEA